MKYFPGIILVLLLYVLFSYQEGAFNDLQFIRFLLYIFLFYSFLLIRRMLYCVLKSKAVYAPKEFLEKNRPFYISRTKWECILEIAREQKKDHDIFCGYISRIRSYVSCREKPDYGNDEEWRSLIHKAFRQ